MRLVALLSITLLLTALPRGTAAQNWGEVSGRVTETPSGQVLPGATVLVAATNFVGMLDEALFRRFDDVVEYTLPTDDQVKSLVQNRLGEFGIGRLGWQSIFEAAHSLSHAEITRACQDAAKDAILESKKSITTKTLVASLKQRRIMERFKG